MGKRSQMGLSFSVTGVDAQMRTGRTQVAGDPNEKGSKANWRNQGFFHEFSAQEALSEVVLFLSPSSLCDVESCIFCRIFLSQSIWQTFYTSERRGLFCREVNMAYEKQTIKQHLPHLRAQVLALDAVSSTVAAADWTERLSSRADEIFVIEWFQIHAYW